jgi:hypothetical protein
MMLRTLCTTATLIAIPLFVFGCDAKKPVAQTQAPQPTPVAAAAVTAAPAKVGAAAASAKSAAAPVAKLGEAAPQFTLKDLDGKDVALSGFKGKVVVLEWFNPNCPFVNAAHTQGPLVNAAARHMKEGVVWLSINSSGPGKEGNGVDKSRDGAARFNMPNPILIDEDGKVGHAFGAERTPHMFIVNKEGILVYHGPADNSPDGEGRSPIGGKLVNYIDAALADLATGHPVAIPEAPVYGCHVHYSDS